MTKEEALDYLKRIKENYTWCCEEDALEMAIKALEQCEVWNGMHGQVVAPKGTFDRIWNDAEREEQEICGDSISRQATLRSYDGLKDDDVIAVWLIRKNIEQQKTVNPQEPKTGWIPVSERLPEKDGCYLVTTTGTNNDIIDIAFYTDDIWHKASKVKAWMPLPEPYKEG